MWSLIDAAFDPSIDICLHSLDGFLELFAKRDLVKLLEHRLVEPFADPIGLRASAPYPRGSAGPRTQGQRHRTRVLFRWQDGRRFQPGFVIESCLP